MLLVGQSLELHREPLLDAAARGEALPVVRRARRQVEDGADALDVNAGLRVDAATLAWAARSLRDAGIDEPLWLDAADTSTLRAAVESSRGLAPIVANAWAPGGEGGQALLAAVATSGAGLVVSPRNAADAHAPAEALAEAGIRGAEAARAAGVRGPVYVDALAWPPASSGLACRRSLAVLRLLADGDAVPLAAVGNVSAGASPALAAALRRTYAAAAAGAGARALLLPVEDTACVRAVRLALGEAYPADVDETYLAALPHATAHGEQPAPPPASASAPLREAWRALFAS